MSDEGDDRVVRAFEALRDDYERQGGFLSVDGVIRQIARRELSATQARDLRALLEAEGIEPEDEAGEPEVEEHASAPTSSPTAVGRTEKTFRRIARRQKLLTREEEVMLARRMRQGREAFELLADAPADQALSDAVRRGREARARLVKSNLGLVAKVALQFSAMTEIEETDLIQEGVIGLMKGIERFDPELGFKLSTYATWWIRQSVQRAIADKGRTVRLPVHVGDTLNALRKTRRALRRELNREPTAKELAKQMNVPTEKVHFLQTIGQHLLSLDKPLKGGEDEGITLADTLAGGGFAAPDKLTEQAELFEALSDALTSLSEKEQRVLTLRFGLGGEPPMTLEAVGEIFDVTRERIRQIEKKALGRMRHPSRSESLREFLDSYGLATDESREGEPFENVGKGADEALDGSQAGAHDRHGEASGGGTKR